MPKKERTKDSFVNKTRLEIFRFICENPATYFYELSKYLDIPIGTLTWHLMKMEDYNIVNSTKFLGKRFYYPRHLRDESVEHAFAALRNETAFEIFNFIDRFPGCIQEDIASHFKKHHDTIRWHVNRLADAKLVRIESRGRRKYHFIDILGEELLEGKLNKINPQFINFVFELFEREGMSPKILEATQETLIIEINFKEYPILHLKMQKLGESYIHNRFIEFRELSVLG